MASASESGPVTTNLHLLSRAARELRMRGTAGAGVARDRSWQKLHHPKLVFSALRLQHGEPNIRTTWGALVLSKRPPRGIPCLSIFHWQELHSKQLQPPKATRKSHRGHRQICKYGARQAGTTRDLISLLQWKTFALAQTKGKSEG